jgi:hypothetical protein
MRSLRSAQLPCNVHNHAGTDERISRYGTPVKPTVHLRRDQPGAAGRPPSRGGLALPFLDRGRSVVRRHHLAAMIMGPDQPLLPAATGATATRTTTLTKMTTLE